MKRYWGRHRERYRGCYGGIEDRQHRELYRGLFGGRYKEHFGDYTDIWDDIGKYLGNDTRNIREAISLGMLLAERRR